MSDGFFLFVSSQMIQRSLYISETIRVSSCLSSVVATELCLYSLLFLWLCVFFVCASCFVFTIRF